jgi:NitT/TauT family transport system ATP-binding protein
VHGSIEKYGAVAAMDGDFIIEVRRLSHAFSVSGSHVPVFQDVSINVRRGEFLSILGPSGCGKSTLLQIMAGLIPYDAGEVCFNGERVQGPPPAMVYLFQQYTKSLLPWRSVIGNIGFAMEGRGISRDQRRERGLDYLRIVGLADFANHYPWQLSGGMQQRVAIARALAAEPTVLLMDEPFSAVDALTRLELQSLLLDIWAKTGLTVVLVTHDVDEAVFMADRVAMLSHRPASVDRVVATDLPRPRDSVATRELSHFLDLRRGLLDTLLKRNPAAAHA